MYSWYYVSDIKLLVHCVLIELINLPWYAPWPATISLSWDDNEMSHDNLFFVSNKCITRFWWSPSSKAASLLLYPDIDWNNGYVDNWSRTKSRISYTYNIYKVHIYRIYIYIHRIHLPYSFAWLPSNTTYTLIRPLIH